MVVGYFNNRALNAVAVAVAAPRPLKTSSYRRPFERMIAAYERDAIESLDGVRESAGGPLAHVVNPRLVASRTSTKVTGPQRLATLQRTLDQMGLKRSRDQRHFHREMTKSVLRQLFRDDLPENLETLYEQFACETFDSCVMFVTPRRWGKTTSVAMFNVAATAAIERLEQSIFSTGRRASGKLLELVYHLLSRVPGMKESIVKKNVECLWIQGDGGPQDIRKIGSYPSKVKISFFLFFCTGNDPETPTLSFFNPKKFLSISWATNQKMDEKIVELFTKKYETPLEKHELCVNTHDQNVLDAIEKARKILETEYVSDNFIEEIRTLAIANDDMAKETPCPWSNIHRVIISGANGKLFKHIQCYAYDSQAKLFEHMTTMITPNEMEIFFTNMVIRTPLHAYANMFGMQVESLNVCVVAFEIFMKNQAALHALLNGKMNINYDEMFALINE